MNLIILADCKANGIRFKTGDVAMVSDAVAKQLIALKRAAPLTFPANPKRGMMHTLPDGSQWIFEQPRNKDGTFMGDIPCTPEVESALAWIPRVAL
jgi:hypothetical protein